MILTSTDNQTNLPRYFARGFAVAQRLNKGRLDIVLPDGRIFRAEGKNPGPVAELHIHNPDCFGRLIREGDLGFTDAYLDGWWSTPDLMAFMDVMHAENEELFDGYPGMVFVRAFEKLRQPVPDTNLSVEEKRGSPETTSTYMPGRLLSQ